VPICIYFFLPLFAAVFFETLRLALLVLGADFAFLTFVAAFRGFSTLLGDFLAAIASLRMTATEHSSLRCPRLLQLREKVTCEGRGGTTKKIPTWCKNFLKKPANFSEPYFFFYYYSILVFIDCTLILFTFAIFEKGALTNVMKFKQVRN
jgi:hypothetical protein